MKMKINAQLNSISDRTLISGVVNRLDVPNQIKCNNRIYNVLGISNGVPLPHISLELEKTSDNLEGCIAEW